jgi:hypothetical protein
MATPPPDIPRRPEAPAVFSGPPSAEALADPRLLAEGWVSRFVGQGERLTEMSQLYRSLGFEVLEVPLTPAMMGEDCADCRVVALLDFRLIYTRREIRARTVSG